MEYLVVCLVAMIASGLTLFSGFGLGTILTPVLAVFFPLPVAIAATAVVHLSNNLFKLFLVGRYVNKKVIIHFALPAMAAALAGAWLLNYTGSLPVLVSYNLMGKIYEITAVKLTVGMLIIVFSIFELISAFDKIAFDQKYMPIGGLLSGFFGGLSGMQGALRSMFLIKSGLEKEEFIGTNVVTAVMVDFGRLLVYGIAFYSIKFAVMRDTWGLVAAAALSAFLGAYLGKRVLKKVTLHAVQIIVGIMLAVLGLAISLGLI